jgi:cytochrome c-type biogenesis protein CcmH
MRSRRTAISLLAVCASLWGSVAPALAAAGCPRTTEVALESRIMCQVCGVPLALANSLEADRERALITQLVNRCESASQIEAAMVAQYGPGILATPGTRGFAIAAWLVPAIGIAAAALAIGAVLMSTRRIRQAAPAAPPPTAAEDERLDAALATFAGPVQPRRGSRPPPPGMDARRNGPTDAERSEAKKPVAREDTPSIWGFLPKRRT